MDTEHSEPTRKDGQAPDPVRPPGAATTIEQTQPSPGVGGTGLGQAPAPAGLAYSMPPQQPQAGYGAPFQPGSAPPGGPARARRNWTPCYVGACLFLLLVLAGAITFAIWAGQHLGKGVMGSMFSLAMRMDELQKDVSATPIESIKSSAAPATMQEVQANPADFSGKWLELEGTLTGEPSKSEGNLALGGSAQNIEAMMYPVDPPVVILDVSGSPAVAHKGDTVRAYGKGMVWDFSNISELPFVGKAIEEGMKNDPTLKGQTSVYFFIAKQVELAPALPEAGTSGAQTDKGETEGGKNDGAQKDDESSDTGGHGVDTG